MYTRHPRADCGRFLANGLAAAIREDNHAYQPGRRENGLLKIGSVYIMYYTCVRIKYTYNDY